MQNWEPFHSQSNTCKDDPWDFSAQRKRELRQGRRAEVHTDAPGHQPGACDDTPAPHEQAPTPPTALTPPSPPSPPPKPPVNEGAGVPPQAPRAHRPARRRRKNPVSVIVIIIAVVVLVNLIPTLISLLGGSSSYDEIVWDDDDSGFALPDESDEASSSSDSSASDSSEYTEESSTTSESYIELYDGTTDFRLQLNTADGLDELSYQEIYASVLPSVVTLTVRNGDTGAYATGIILTEDGYILTNQHVVGGEAECEVTTWDDQTYDALLVGEDPNSDLAVIKIDAQGLTPAQFGDNEELTVGDECFAIGDPLGIRYRNTFTNGIISALNRSVNVNDYSMTLIQTTAALNAGNSGGPLINTKGQVVGVVNMKIMSSTTTVEGLGFAIPVSTVQKVVNSILENGYVEHPVIGITCYSVSVTYDDTEISGLMIDSVDSNSDVFGMLIPGDIITAVNGTPVQTVSDVAALINGLHVGDSINLSIFHEDGTTEDIDILLVESDDLAGD